MTPDRGHLMPAGLAIIWVLARVSLYDWPLASAVIMVLVAAASLALLRVLLTLFGARPGILVPLTLYLFAPLSVGTVAWLAAAVKILPLELALFLAVDAHVRYARAPRRRTAAAAVCWLLVGMASADQGAVVPLLLFAITVAFLGPACPAVAGTAVAGTAVAGTAVAGTAVAGTAVAGTAPAASIRWAAAASQALTRYRRIWLLYGALLVGYCALFFAQLSRSGTALPGPGQTTSLYRFAGTLIGVNAIPGMLGGPWRWVASGYAQAGPPAGLEYASWALAAVVIAASVAGRRGAWPAWAILLGWVVIADLVPVAVEGFGGFSPATLGTTTGYVADATAVLALCVGLVVLRPSDGSPDLRAPSAAVRSRPVRAVAVTACCVFAAGAAVSLPAFVAATPSAAPRSYIATARAAIRDAPPGTVVIDGPAPAAVLSAGFFGAAADTSRVIEPLAGGPGTRLSWTAAPAGVLARPMMFDDLGRLLPLTVAGPSWVPPAIGSTCLQGPTASTRLTLDGSLYQWTWIVRLSYSGSAGALVIRLGQGRGQVSVPAGAHDVYVPVAGQGNTVSVQLAGTEVGPVCITGVTVGLPQPDPAGQAIPAAAVPG
jgi:hypothetical protein